MYDCELEKVEGFAEFNDFVQSFPLERGKAMEVDEDMEIAKAKSKSKTGNAKCKAKRIRSRAKLGNGITSACISKSTMCPGPRRPTLDTYIYRHRFVQGSP